MSKSAGMRAPSFLLAGLGSLAVATTGCFGGHVRGPCEHRGLSTPSWSSTFELRRPANPAPIGGEAQVPALKPAPFDVDEWAGTASAKLPARALPVLGGKEGELLVCAFEAGPSPGIDGIDVVGTPPAYFSVPDLMVWADLAGTKLRKGAKVDSRTATFLFDAALEKGQPITFTLGDYDVFSADDFIGKIEGAYPGQVPFHMRGAGGTATCNALPRERLAAEADARAKKLEGVLAALESREATIEEAFDPAIGEEISRALGAVLAFRGVSPYSRTDPLVVATTARVEAASKRLWARHLELLREKQASLPAPGTWVSAGPSAEVRVSGLRCEKSAYSSVCHPEVEIRIKPAASPAPSPLCPVEKGMLGQIGPFHVYRATGGSRQAQAERVFLEGRWAEEQRELADLPAGSVVGVSLESDFSRDGEKGWDVPLVRVGTVYLRVY